MLYYPPFTNEVQTERVGRLPGGLVVRVGNPGLIPRLVSYQRY